MSVKARDLVKGKQDLDKLIDFKDIDLDNVDIGDLTYNGDNYDDFIHLKSFLANVSVCQISDAYSQISSRSGVISDLKSVNNLKTWGRITTARTSSDDWGTCALAIDEASGGDVIFIEVEDMDAAVWGELASKSACNKNIKSTMVCGCVRDLDALLDMDYPVFAYGYLPNAGKPLGLGEINVKLNIDNVSVSPGDFVFGDESGVCLIPQKYFTEVIRHTFEVKVRELEISDGLASGMTLSELAGLR